jgi:hypothetical protein
VCTTGRRQLEVESNHRATTCIGLMPSCRGLGGEPATCDSNVLVLLGYVLASRTLPVTVAVTVKSDGLVKAAPGPGAPQTRSARRGPGRPGRSGGRGAVAGPGGRGAAGGVY